jgi:hypothetical protein
MRAPSIGIRIHMASARSTPVGRPAQMFYLRIGPDSPREQLQELASFVGGESVEHRAVLDLDRAG